jgi:3-deoxy-manno-octulosonate cytidylyltransferase (CMP-KDO synthetase)
MTASPASASGPSGAPRASGASDAAPSSASTFDPSGLTPFVALIPARLASTRLPDKPLADIGGSPMVVLVARRASEAGAKRVVVATDSERIAQAVREAGFEAVMTATDHPSGTDRLAEAARLLGLREDEIVVNVQGDEPLIDPALVRAVAARLAASPDCAMATAAHAIHDAADWSNPNVVKLVLDRSQRALLFSRSPIPFDRDGERNGEGDSAPPAGALRHIGLYAYRTGFLLRYPQLERAPIEQLESLEQLRALWHGHRIVVEVAESAPAPGVDTEADLERVRRLLQESPRGRRASSIPAAGSPPARDPPPGAAHQN